MEYQYIRSSWSCVWTTPNFYVKVIFTSSVCSRQGKHEIILYTYLALKTKIHNMYNDVTCKTYVAKCLWIYKCQMMYLSSKGVVILDERKFWYLAHIHMHIHMHSFVNFVLWFASFPKSPSQTFKIFIVLESLFKCYISLLSF